MWDDEDFYSDDPVARFNAHQRAKGREPLNLDAYDLRDKTVSCEHTARTYDGAPLVCEKRKGHGGYHEQSSRLRDRVERTNWGSDGLGIHATKDRP